MMTDFLNEVGTTEVARDSFVFGSFINLCLAHLFLFPC